MAHTAVHAGQGAKVVPLRRRPNAHAALGRGPRAPLGVAASPPPLPGLARSCKACPFPMLVYTKAHAPAALLLSVLGSGTVLRALPYAALAAGIAGALHSRERGWLEAAVGHPYALGLFCFVPSFAVVFRTNQALARYGEAATALSQMHAKWGDAAAELLFLDGAGCDGAKTAKDVAASAAFADDVVSKFSALSAAALLYLRRDSNVGGNARNVSLPGDDVRIVLNEPREASALDALRRAIWPYTRAQTQAHNDRSPLAVLGATAVLDQDGDAALINCRSAVTALWTTRLRTDSDVGLKAMPPPIVSRVPQFLSDGGLGWAQAKKLADVPFACAFGCKMLGGWPTASG